MSRDKLRVGLVVPSSNTVMEPDFHRWLGSSCIVSTARMYLEEVTREAEVRMIEEDLPRCLRLLKTTAPHVVAFGCTSAGSLGGLANEDAIAASIEREAGVVAVTVLKAILAQLELFRVRRVAVFTPYEAELTRSVAACIAEGGYELATTAGMGIRDNREIGRVTPAQIVEFVESRMRGVRADCVFLSCTNWQAIAAIAAVKKRFDVPVTSSNHATLEAVKTCGSARAAAPASAIRA